VEAWGRDMDWEGGVRCGKSCKIRDEDFRRIEIHTGRSSSIPAERVPYVLSAGILDTWARLVFINTDLGAWTSTFTIPSRLSLRPKKRCFSGPPIQTRRSNVAPAQNFERSEDCWLFAQGLRIWTRLRNLAFDHELGIARRGQASSQLGHLCNCCV